MTNNAQLVSVPRELLERLAYGEWECASLKDRDTLRDLLAAPAEDVRDCPNCTVCVGSPLMPKGCAIDNGQYAEDVRAVVEEPVAWMQFDGEGNNDFTDDHETAERWAKNNGPKYVDWLTPLYRHPERPVVLPERRDENPRQSDANYNSDCGWNACLDAVEELNK